jgi:hypothetical protein
MERERGCEWYQSIGLEILYIFADFISVRKPQSFKQQKNGFDLLNNSSRVVTESMGVSCLSSLCVAGRGLPKQADRKGLKKNPRNNKKGEPRYCSTAHAS